MNLPQRITILTPRITKQSHFDLRHGWLDLYVAADPADPGQKDTAETEMRERLKTARKQLLEAALEANVGLGAAAAMQRLDAARDQGTVATGCWRGFLVRCDELGRLGQADALRDGVDEQPEESSSSTQRPTVWPREQAPD